MRFPADPEKLIVKIAPNALPTDDAEFGPAILSGIKEKRRNLWLWSGILAFNSMSATLNAGVISWSLPHWRTVNWLNVIFLPVCTYAAYVSWGYVKRFRLELHVLRGIDKEMKCSSLSPP